MNIPKLIIFYLFASLLLFSNCKENSGKDEAKDTIKQLAKVNSNATNKTSIIKKENVFEISQAFVNENNQSIIISEPVKLDLSLTSGAMISAYSKHNEDYKISYKTFENSSWSNWLELPENKEVKNPKRKAFKAKSLNNSVKQIQFKSNKITKSKVVFRVYTFQK